ncbi:MAG: peptidoglycan DD-metalloendopeptidase family protein [Gemmatimonadota bacterium]|jgi:septal ring factor EnvC (AmiA/AmiB activator)|nr:peptidoglycan DD-metalloendopeptidase family protein [Gemmatimonadota bacterium]MDP6803435.1 peptidoglycan DD-metalloendopeptidase family protein [Gemmatimonadota bacterium]MDP7030928.1 peptidoglycan DD-metalloendopeptidase family protein [Gemmatimonadota bacterium]
MVTARLPGPAVVFLTAMLVALPPVSRGAADETQVREEIQREETELQRIESDLDRTRDRTRALSDKETRVLTELNRIDSDLTRGEAAVSRMRAREESLAKEAARAGELLVQEEARLDERREILRRRLRNIYMYGERAGLQVLLSATSAVDLVRRFDWLLLVAAQDRRLERDVRVAVEAVADASTELESRHAESEAVRRDAEQEQAGLRRSQGDRRKLLESVRGEREGHERIARELESARASVQELLAELEEQARRARRAGELPAGGTGFAGAKGGLPWPVEGRLSRRFGVKRDPRFGTSTFSGGLDIQAPAGTEVIAVHRGRVDYVDWLPGYGQCIILNHGNGYYTLYAHTERVFVAAGDGVFAGERVATVGDTGSLTGDALHFEIRKDAEPVDPLPWLGPARLR